VLIPHGTIPLKCESSGSTFRLTPWKLTQRLIFTPMAAILSSRECPGRLALDPDADAAVACLSVHVELFERADDPGFQTLHEGAHVAAPPLQVEHHVGHALAWAVIGELPAASCPEHRQQVGLQQVLARAVTPAV
jgi:hypothetical protein